MVHKSSPGIDEDAGAWLIGSQMRRITLRMEIVAYLSMGLEHDVERPAQNHNHQRHCAEEDANETPSHNLLEHGGFRQR